MEKVYGVFAVPECGAEVVCRTFADAEELMIDLANEDAYDEFYTAIHGPGYGAKYSVERALQYAEWAFDEWYVQEILLF